MVKKEKDVRIDVFISACMCAQILGFLRSLELGVQMRV